MTNNVIDVNTGEVKSGGNDAVLRSNAIGSCVVVVVYDPYKNLAALAHIMLPGRSPDKNKANKTRYAFDAISEMLDQLKEYGVSDLKQLKAFLVGGANVLKRDNDTIGQDNIFSIENILHQFGIKVERKHVGGTDRRTVLFEVEKGSLYYTVGDSSSILLYKNIYN